MLWTEIRKWAKDRGYETLKEKENDITSYYWAKLDTPDASGISKSVSKLAFDIYNHMTDNKWLDYQKEYKQKIEESQEHIDMTNYATG
jgi:hypothetical protein